MPATKRDRPAKRVVVSEVPRVAVRLTTAQLQVLDLDGVKVRAIYGVEHMTPTKHGAVLLVKRTGAQRMLRDYNDRSATKPGREQPLHWYQVAKTAAHHIERVLRGDEVVRVPNDPVADLHTLVDEAVADERISVPVSRVADILTRLDTLRSL